MLRCVSAYTAFTSGVAVVRGAPSKQFSKTYDRKNCRKLTLCLHRMPLQQPGFACKLAAANHNKGQPCSCHCRLLVSDEIDIHITSRKYLPRNNIGVFAGGSICDESGILNHTGQSYCDVGPPVKHTEFNAYTNHPATTTRHTCRYCSNTQIHSR